MKLHERRLFKLVKNVLPQFLPDELILMVLPKLSVNTKYPQPYPIFTSSSKIPGTIKVLLGYNFDIDHFEIEYNIPYCHDYGVYMGGLVVFSSEDISDCISFSKEILGIPQQIHFIKIDTLFKKLEKMEE